MFEIDPLSKAIFMNRGDSGQFPLIINLGTPMNPIIHKLDNNDTVYLAIEEPNQPFEDAIVKKVYAPGDRVLDANGDLIIKIKPDDTVALMPGKYYYEIKLVSIIEEEMNVNTIVPQTRFTIWG